MSLATNKPLKITPSAAVAVTVTAGGSPFVFGSWAELNASMSATSQIAGFEAVPSAIGFFDLQFGIGSLGNEVPVGGSIMVDCANPASIGTALFMLPVPINAVPSGSRLVARVRRQLAGGSLELKAVYYEGLASDHQITGGYNYAPNGAAGVNVTPSGSAWANSNWFELISSLTDESAILGVSLRGVTDDIEWELDLGTGGAGAESFLTTLRSDTGDQLGYTNRYLPRPLPVPAGTRISCRLRKSNTLTTANVVYLLYIGDVALLDVPEPDVETLVATGVRSTQARIRGRIDPNDIAGVSGYLLWGTSPGSLINATTPQNITNGTVFITFSEILTDLEPDTTYYYRAVADDGSTEYFGDILSFTTLGEQTFIDGDVSHPLTWITLTKRDETRHPYAEVDLNDPPHYYDGYKRPRVQRFLTISRGLSDRDGQIEHLTFGAVLSDIKTDRFDADREFRELLDDVTNKYLTNRPLEEWFIDDEDRRIQGLARLAAVGYVNDYAPRARLQFEINGADWLKKKFSRKRKAQQSWQPLITEEDFENCPEETLNTPAPIIYGSLGLTGADPVENVQLVVNAQPTAAPTGFALSLQAGGRYAGVRRYYKVSQIVAGIESEQSATLSATTTDTNKTIRSSWTPSGSATAIYLYSSDKPDFSQFALTILSGAATSYDDDTTPPNQDAKHLTGTDWQLGLRLNLVYYVYAELAGGLFSRPGIVSTFLAPVPVRATVPDDRTHARRQRDIDITWDAHPDEVGGYRIIRWRSYYSNWTPEFDRQIDVGTGVLTTTDDVVTTSAVSIPDGELIALSATGQVQAIPVGDVTAGSPAQTLNALLIARHACSRVGNIYVPVTVQNVEGEDETTYEPVADSAFGVTWFAPDHTGWLFDEKYVDLNGRRYTLIFTTVSPLPDKVLVDVDGIETDGDGEGTLITSIVDQRLHFMNNFIAPDTPYQSGAYLTAADTTFPHIPDLPLVDEISHQTVKAQLAERLGTGDYEGATIIGAAGEFVTATDALARFHVSGDFDQAFNRKGQDTISCEPIAPSEDLDVITDVVSIQDGSFTIRDEVQTAFFNILPYVHTRDYTGRERIGWYGKDEARSQTSIDNYDQERESPRFELHCLRSNTTQGAATIADVMARKLARYQDPRRTGTLTLPFSGLNYEPGATAAVTHIEGIGAEGWVAKEVRFTHHEVDPTEGEVRLDFYDLTKVFENQAP